MRKIKKTALKTPFLFCHFGQNIDNQGLWVFAIFDENLSVLLAILGDCLKINIVSANRILEASAPKVEE